FAGEYSEVVQNERLVYTEFMCDEHGNRLAPAEMGMPEGHPTTTEGRVELEDVGGRTKMVMTHIGIPADSPGAIGWTMALDKLAARVKAHGDRYRRSRPLPSRSRRGMARFHRPFRNLCKGRAQCSPAA